MLKIILFLFTVISMGYANAQKPDNALALARYEFIHVVDTTMPDRTSQQEMYLYLGKNSSFFMNNKYALMEERMEKLKRQDPVRYPGNTTLNMGVPVYFYRYPGDNIFKSVSVLRGTRYLIEEKIPEINWNISNETKNIQGYKCQKATTFFRGRSYEAWFCDQLAYNNGPWKLGGLPGLILEAYDTKKEVVFRFQSFEENAATYPVINPPSNYTVTDTKELTRVIRILIEDPFAGMVIPPGTQIMSAGGTGPNGEPIKKTRYNNPIEREN